MFESESLASLERAAAIAAPDNLFWAALLLVAGALAGEVIARTTRLPRIVGYSAAGCLAAWAGAGPVMPLQGLARQLLDLGLALLLFEIGSRVRLRWLRRNPMLLATSLAEAVLGAIAVYAVLIWIELAPALAAVCAVMVMPSSAAVAGRVALELGAEGQVTDRMNLLTALDTLYAALALTLLAAWLMAGHDGGGGAAALVVLARSLAGSLVLAALLAVVVAAVARRLDLRNESAVLLVLGLVVLALGAARAAGLSTLLVPLLAGLMLRNASERPWVWPRHFGTAGGVVVLTMFVIVGASWSPAVLAAGGLAALALVGARGLAKGCAVVLLCRPAGASLRQGLALAVTLTPLSATVLVMLSELYRARPDLAAAAMPIVLSAVAVLELLGPIAVQAALRLAGDLSPAPARAPRKEPR